MPSKYGIDSYHIGVGAGDAAIHLLIGDPDTSTAQIVRALLVDAGDYDRTVPYLTKPRYPASIQYNIKATIASICSKYQISSLQFDAIVVTHWDADHFGGIDDLINIDIEEQLAANPPPATIQIRFMKYDTTTGDPQTVLFAPYWKAGGAAFSKPPQRWLAIQTPAKTMVMSFV